LLSADDPRRARLLLARGRAGWLLGRPEGAESLLEASEAFERQDEPEAAAEAEMILSRFYWLRGERESADRRTAHALALVADRPATPTQARVLAWRARDLFLQGDHGAALELAQRTLSVATEIGEDDIMSHVLNTVGSTRVMFGDAGGLDDLRRSADFARSARSPENLHNALNNLANMYWRVGRLDMASAALAEAREANEHYGYAAGLRWLAGEDMLDHYFRGDWDGALRIAETLLGLGAGRHYQDAPAHVIRAEVSLARGDLERALADAERALELARSAADEQLVGPAVVGRASVLGAAGRRAEADVLLDEALREHDLVESMIYQLPLMLAELGRGDQFLAALGDDTPATPWADAARAVAGGDFGRGAEIYAEIGAQAPAARARLLNAEVLVAEGRRAEADVELQRALAYSRRVGATAWTRRGEALLAATA
jgi:tetratricopeptide (TPR) repeat protein